MWGKTRSLALCWFQEVLPTDVFDSTNGNVRVWVHGGSESSHTNPKENAELWWLLTTTEWYVCPVHDTCTIAFMDMLVQFFVYSFTNVAVGAHTTSIGWTFGTRRRWTLAEFDAPPVHCWLPSSTKDYIWWSWLLTASHRWASQYVQDLVSRSNHSSEVSLHGPYAKAH